MFFSPSSTSLGLHFCRLVHRLVSYYYYCYCYLLLFSPVAHHVGRNILVAVLRGFHVQAKVAQRGESARQQRKGTQRCTLSGLLLGPLNHSHSSAAAVAFPSSPSSPSSPSPSPSSFSSSFFFLLLLPLLYFSSSSFFFLLLLLTLLYFSSSSSSYFFFFFFPLLLLYFSFFLLLLLLLLSFFLSAYKCGYCEKTRDLFWAAPFFSSGIHEVPSSQSGTG